MRGSEAERRQLLRSRLTKFRALAAPRPDACSTWGLCPAASGANSRLVHAAGFELALLDPQRLRKLGIITANFLDEALCILAADEDVDGVAKQVTRERVVNDGKHEHRTRIADPTPVVEIVRTDTSVGRAP
jgi:hypothetical protein